jgi:hypothetical protein
MRIGVLLVIAGSVSCQAVPHHGGAATAARISAMDTATVRRLCVQPDSVLAGRRSCELRNQQVFPKVF